MNKNDYIIRLERNDEHREVEHLIREAFWNVYRPGCLEHYVIHQLRNDPAFVHELNFVMAGDVHPTAASPVLVANGNRIVTEIQRWGLPRPQGSGRVINARAETALERLMFHSSVLERRCVIAANAFYEWDKAKYQYIFRPLNGGCLYMAGLFDRVEDVNCFVILTTAANASMQGVHDRMPLILHREQVRPWPPCGCW